MFRKSLHGLAVLLLLTAGAAAAQPTTIHVSPVSGNPLASGTALLNALAAITDAGAFKSYVIKLDPGGYNVWATQLVMKPYVDIEGSGQGSTSIEGLGNADGSYLTGIIQAAPQAELRNLQVVSTGSGYTTSIGIYVPSGANASIRDVTITAGSASNNWGIRSLAASPSIQNVTINVSTAGNQSYGIGSTSSNANPTIKHTVINLSGSGTYAYGLYSDGVAAPLEMRDIEISIVGSSLTGAYGFWVDNAGSGQTFLLTGSTVSVSGATYNYGAVFYGGASAVLNLKTTYLKASGANSYGLYVAAGSSGASLNHCEVTGTTAIQAFTAPVYVGASRIAGTVTGATTCSGAYNAYYAALSTSCH
jgi:hypothetical protein